MSHDHHHANHKQRAFGLGIGLNLIFVAVEAVADFLAKRSEVRGVHHRHIWAMSTTETALTVHLVVAEMPAAGFLKELSAQLERRFRIDHPRVQLELPPSGEDCETDHAHCRGAI